jgi:aspartate 1-decarboxylase
MTTIPEPLNFASAIAFTQELLTQSKISAAEIAQLVQTEDGARGFFVTYLTSDLAVSEEIIIGLRSQIEIVSELLVKNLAMSTAQELYHHRRKDEEMAQSSRKVQVRTAQLIELVSLDLVYEKLQQLIASIDTGSGSYQAFLERWNYDAEQKQVIKVAINKVLGKH